MQTETIEITGLPLGTKTALEEVGRSRGKNFADYLRDLLQTELLSEKPFSEILEPIRRSFDESGMSAAEQLEWTKGYLEPLPPDEPAALTLTGMGPTGVSWFTT